LVLRVMVAVRTSKSFKHQNTAPRADVAQRRHKEKSWVCWGKGGWVLGLVFWF
jgi:hypothetical protein